MESRIPEQSDLLAQQKKILQVLRKSHRFLMGHIFSSVFGMYSIMLWVILFVGMSGFPLPLLSLATVIILIPIIGAPLQYRSAKRRFGTLQRAGDYLGDLEEALSESIVVAGLSSYIFLILDVIRPTTLVGHASDDEREVEDLRKQLTGLTRNAISEILLQGILITALIINFLIPEFIDAINAGSPLILPYLLLIAIVVVLNVRWAIFIYWRIMVRKWLRFHQGFLEWGEDLERNFLASEEDSS